MKKIFALLLAVMMLCTSAVFASESERDEAEKVLLLVKERIGNTDEYEEFTSTSNENNGNITYTFRWNSEDKWLNITVNSEGVITSYNKFYDKEIEEIKPTLNKMSSDEALEKTKVLFEKLNPTVAQDIKIIKDSEYEGLFERGYTFTLQRTHNDIDVLGDNGYIRVSPGAEMIEFFNMTYTQNLTFESSENIIDREKACESYKKEIGMELYYDFENDKAELFYEREQSDVHISAISGKTINPIEPQHRFFSKNESVTMDSAAPMAGGGLSEAEIKTLDKIDGLISAENAEKIIREKKILSVDESMTLSYTGIIYIESRNEYYYDLYFEGDGKSASANVDAQNGNILSYSFYEDKYEEVKTDYTKKAKEYAQILAPSYYKADDSLAYRFTKGGAGSYTFNRYENNIPFRGNTISVNVDEKGVLTYYNIRYTKTEFESPEGILSEEEICNKLFETCGYKLYYYPACSNEEKTVADVAHLIYDVENENTVLKAKTGEKKYKDDSVKIGDYTDIEGHYAYEQITALGKFGIGFEESEFRPDDKISQKDYIALMSSALLYSSPVVLTKNGSVSEEYYQRAYNGKYVKENENNPDGTVTRSMAAVFMARILGFDEVASLEGIYVSKFADVKENIGHISILNALGVINGHGGNFEPGRELTRAEATIMLYNYLCR